MRVREVRRSIDDAGGRRRRQERRLINVRLPDGFLECSTGVLRCNLA
jgi:hypothetical protein